MVLIGDKDYDQGHVVKVLCKVIAGLGAMKAVAAFQEAQSKGKAIVLICDEVRTYGCVYEKGKLVFCSSGRILPRERCPWQHVC